MPNPIPPASSPKNNFPKNNFPKSPSPQALFVLLLILCGLLYGFCLTVGY